MKKKSSMFQVTQLFSIFLREKIDIFFFFPVMQSIWLKTQFAEMHRQYVWKKWQVLLVRAVHWHRPILMKHTPALIATQLWLACHRSIILAIKKVEMQVLCCTVCQQMMRHLANTNSRSMLDNTTSKSLVIASIWFGWVFYWLTTTFVP